MAEDRPANEPGQVSMPDLLDARRLADVRALGEPDSPDVLVELLGMFERDSEARLPAMRRALAAEQWDIVWRTAHTLSSSAASLGAARLAALGKHLERIGLVRDRTAADAALTAIEACYPETKEALRAACSR